MDAYRSRTKVGIETYRRWLARVSDWNPKNAGSTWAPQNGAKKTAGQRHRRIPHSLGARRAATSRITPRLAAVMACRWSPWI
jgi:hypothetical protein